MDRPVALNPLPNAIGQFPVSTAGALAIVVGSGRSSRPADASRTGGDSDTFVCPFCGETYAGSRRRCASCDGLPVVPRENREVYEAVVGLCGPDCGPSASGGSRSTTYSRPTTDPR